MTDAPTTPELANDATRGSHCGCSDLLACPFCGSGEVKFSPPANDPDPSDDVLCSWQVVCGQCGATGGNQCDENTARLAWNTRRDHAAFYPSAWLAACERLRERWCERAYYLDQLAGYDTDQLSQQHKEHAKIIRRCISDLYEEAQAANSVLGDPCKE